MLAQTAQAKLLRVLEERKVRPVGGNRFEPVRARIILATRRNLEDASDEQFRRDLFERLRGFTLVVPPLRERRSDLPLLVRRFVDEYNREYPGDRKIPPQALDALFRYSWPGNVRELRLAVRQAAAYAPGSEGSISALINMAANKNKKYSEEAIRMLRDEFKMPEEPKNNVIERAKRALGEPRYTEEIKF